MSSEFLPWFPEYPYAFLLLFFLLITGFRYSVCCMAALTQTFLSSHCWSIPCQCLKLMPCFAFHPVDHIPLPQTLKILLHDPYSFPNRGLGIYQLSSFCGILSFLPMFLSYMKKSYFTMQWQRIINEIFKAVDSAVISRMNLYNLIINFFSITYNFRVYPVSYCD